ncbi:MAG: hypothetical protein RLY14_1434 [Planctomycetota bacterium]|jgi:hypothetical protein
MHFVRLPLIVALICLQAAPVLFGFQSKSNSKSTAKPAAKKSTPKPGTTNLEKVPLPDAILTLPKAPPFKVAQIDRTKRSEIEKAATAIDSIIAKDLTANNEKERPALKDDLFLRRVYLELGGRIPTYQEAKVFLDSQSGTKRSQLIDQLLESPDYVSHFYNYWADILRLTERPTGNIFLEPYLSYVKESIANNKPYDRWVHEMLTADGKVWDNPAAGFQIRDQGMPLPYVDNTVRVFLGKQIGCAQCHDHPFDDWTQKQFYQLAAFTAGTQTRFNRNIPEVKNGRGMNAGDIIKVARDKDPMSKLLGPLQQLVNANTFAVNFADRPLKLPHDYQYSDAKPNEVVEPKVLWDSVPATAAKANRREQFAAWVTSRSNRQFARNIANRLWKKMMGRGIVHPVDDFNDENKPSNPELLEHLTDEMLRLNFDLREFVRIIAYTKTYQRQAMVHESFDTKPFRFAGPVLKRMTAEQIWDSLVTLVAYNQWAFQRPTARDLAPMVDINWATVQLMDAEAAANRYSNSYFPSYYNQQLQKLCGFEGQLLVRASEIPTPLPLVHFLRQFGQSDREAIEAGRQVATVPQILTMFNGPITHIMLKKGSVIYDNVVLAGPRNAIDVMFISVLSRRPTPIAREIASDEIGSGKRTEVAYGNVIWALLNTREFLFIQ